MIDKWILFLSSVSLSRSRCWHVPTSNTYNKTWSIRLGHTVTDNHDTLLPRRDGVAGSRNEGSENRGANNGSKDGRIMTEWRRRRNGESQIAGTRTQHSTQRSVQGYTDGCVHVGVYFIMIYTRTFNPFPHSNPVMDQHTISCWQCRNGFDGINATCRLRFGVAPPLSPGSTIL